MLSSFPHASTLRIVFVIFISDPATREVSMWVVPTWSSRDTCHSSGNVNGMRTTIDKAGRLVIPRPVSGSGLREDSGLLLIPASGTPLTAEAVRELIDADRHGR